MVVVDIYGGQVFPIPAALSKQRAAQAAEQQKHSTTAGTGGRQEVPTLAPLLRVKQCIAHQLDYQLFASRKGLLVRQVCVVYVRVCMCVCV